MITLALFRNTQMPTCTVPAIFQPRQHLHSPHLPFTCSFFWRFFLFFPVWKTALRCHRNEMDGVALRPWGSEHFRRGWGDPYTLSKKSPAGVNSEVKSYDYKGSWFWVEQLGAHFKEREILALFKFTSSSPLPLVKPELLSAGFHPMSSLCCTFGAAKWHQQNDL